MSKIAAPPPGLRKRATLRTISELTGFSASTVSLSLRGGGGLKEETRRRVEEVAAQIGYVPDRAGVRLRTGKTNVIALVLDGSTDSIDFARQLIQGVGEAIRPTRYHMVVTPEFGTVRSVEAVRYIVENRTADGLIMTHTSPRDPRVRLLMEHDFPFVTHGRTEFVAPHPFHDYHSEEFARLAVERVAAKGCRDAMMVIGGDQTNNYRNIVRAFEHHAARCGIVGEIVNHQVERATSMEMRAFGRTLGLGKRRPFGIVCNSEMRSIYMVSGMLDAGLDMGRDVHFICKQTGDMISTLFPLVDTVEEDVYAAGVELARLLMRRIGGETAGNLQTLAEPKVHWRN